MSSSKYNRVSVKDLLNEDKESEKQVESVRKDGIICHIDSCGRQFVSQESLIAHQKRSHAAPTKYICQYCQSSYSTVPNLNKHVSEYNVLKRFHWWVPCFPVRTSSFSLKLTPEICPWLATSKNGSRTKPFIFQIRSVHEKVKPYKCDKCSSTFAFKDGLQRHNQMVHDQIRPFSCSYCSLMFKTKAHLSKHSLALHPEKHGGSSSSSRTSANSVHTDTSSRQTTYFQ